MILILFLLIIFSGFLLVNLIKNNLELSSKIALGYILGIGLATFISFILNMLGLAFGLTSTISILLISILLLITLNHNIIFDINIFKRIDLQNIITATTTTQKIAIALLIFLLSTSFISSIYWPVKDWDSIVIYDFRAKVFNETGYMNDAIERGYFFNYPLLTSIAHSFVYQTGFQYPGIIHSLFYISLAIIIYDYLRGKTNKTWSLIWTLLIISSPGLYGHAQMTYTNLIYSTYIISSLIFCVKWISDKKNSNLALSSLLLGLSTWTRSAEPFWIVITILIFIYSIKIHRLKNAFNHIIIFLGLVLPWKLFSANQIASIETSNGQNTFEKIFSSFDMSVLFSNIIPVINYFYNNVLFFSLPAYLLLAFVSVIILRNKNKLSLENVKPLLFFIWITLILTLFGIFAFSLYYEKWQAIGGSAQRMTLFVPPIIILMISEFIYQNKKNENT